MNNQEVAENVIFEVQFLSNFGKIFNRPFRDRGLVLDSSTFVDKNIKNLKINLINSEVQISGYFEFKVSRETDSYRSIRELLLGKNRFKLEEFEKFFPISQSRITFINFTNDLIKYLSWRKDSSISNENDWKIRFLAPECHWTLEELSGSLDTEIYYKILEVRCMPFYDADLSSNDLLDFYKLQEGGLAIPVHNEMLNEVSRQLTLGTYNSAYLILYTAFEIATKTLISVKSPETTWLIFNMPAPALDKLYTKYINKNFGEVLKKEDLKILSDMTTNRNKIAHTGSTDIKIDYNLLSSHNLFVKLWVQKINILIGYDWLEGHGV